MIKEDNRVIINSQVFTINVIGDLNGVGATELSEQRLVRSGHSQAAKDGFVGWVPGSKSYNHKTKYITLKTLGEEILVQQFIFVEFPLLGVSKGFWVIFKRAADVHYDDFAPMPTSITTPLEDQPAAQAASQMQHDPQSELS